jgi:hypothetical protein
LKRIPAASVTSVKRTPRSPFDPAPADVYRHSKMVMAIPISPKTFRLDRVSPSLAKQEPAYLTGS